MTDNSLYVAVFRVDESGSTLFCDMRATVVLFVYRYLRQVWPSVFDVRLFIVIDGTISPDVIIETSDIDFSLIESTTDIKLSDVVVCCSLPIFLKENNFCVAGLSAVIRQLFVYCCKESGTSYTTKMLGHKQASLTACPEFSTYTKLCNVDLIVSFKNVVRAIRQLENHVEKIFQLFAAIDNILSKPMRIADSKNRAAAVTSKEKNSPRTYIEGLHFALSDIITFPAVYMSWNTLTDAQRGHLSPHIVDWFNRCLGEFGVTETLNAFKFSIVKSEDDVFFESFTTASSPSADVGSHLVQQIYPCSQNGLNANENDPSGVREMKEITEKTPKKYYTKQKDVEEAINKFDSLDIERLSPISYFDTIEHLDWNAIPVALHPNGGNVPSVRLKRKMEQIESLIFFISKLSKPNDVIVDFCCGMGHVGLLLAYLLPRSKVILLDNKEHSLNEVGKRVAKLNLKNVVIVQSNVDFFVGNFQIGVALHACGVATDLVISKCITRRAHMVVSPCCYGKIKENHVLAYPRSSSLFNHFSHAQFMILAHSADQTHKFLYDKTEQGEKCMDIVDTDRCLHVKQQSYDVSLYKMIPLTCTTKHNIIVGVFDDS